MIETRAFATPIQIDQYHMARILPVDSSDPVGHDVGCQWTCLVLIIHAPEKKLAGSICADEQVVIGREVECADGLSMPTECVQLPGVIQRPERDGSGKIACGYEDDQHQTR